MINPPPADVGKIGEFVYVACGGIKFRRICGSRIYNCLRISYGVVLRIKRWFDELFDDYLVEESIFHCFCHFFIRRLKIFSLPP